MSRIEQLEAELKLVQEYLYSLPPIDDPEVSMFKDIWSSKIGKLKREIDKANGTPQS